MKKIFSLVLALTMCISALSVLFFTASASSETATNTTGIVNLYEFKGYGEPNATAVDGDVKANISFITGKAIDVKEGDVIRIAPVVQAQTYQATAYKVADDGSVTTVKVNASNVTFTPLGDSKESLAILEYTVPAGVTKLAPVGSQLYRDSYVVTKNQELTRENLVAYWAAQGLTPSKFISGIESAKPEEIFNLFSDAEGACGVNIGEAHAGKVGGLGTNAKYRGTKAAIEMTADDVVYFVAQTPASGNAGHYVSEFKADGTGIANLKHAYLSVYADLGNNFVVYAYRPAETVASVRISCILAYYEAGIILVTKNQPFDGATFRAWCKLNNVNCDLYIGEDPNAGSTEVDPGFTATGLVNLFQEKKYGGAGLVNAAAHSNTNKYPNGYDTNTNNWCTEMIPVKKGDVLYFLGINTAGYHVTLFDLNGNGYGDTDKRVVPADLTVVETLGKFGNVTYNIYSYTIDDVTGYVRVSERKIEYDSGCVLLTKNQPFDKAKLKAYCDAKGADLATLVGDNLPKVEVDTTSPLYKKSAFFIGDSIIYGLGEERFDPTLPRLSYSGRLEQKFDMTVINVGDSGARVSQTGSSGYIIDGVSKWTYENDPDMIIMHAGGNDARYCDEVPMGTVDSTDIYTFCGGLNKLFRVTRSKYPNADIFYVSYFYIAENKGNISKMEPYYELAKQICEKWGVHYIDLHGNAELKAKLYPNSLTDRTYMPDLLHPNAAGYDIITPYLIEALEAFYTTPENPPVNTDTAPIVPDTTPATPDTTPATPDTTPVVPDTTPVTPDTTPQATEPEKNSCGGVSAIASVLALIAVSAAAIILKKNN